MKMTGNLRKWGSLALLLVFLSVSITACDHDDDSDKIVVDKPVDDGSENPN